jgi:hypothetical protein|nr:MAG TPA: hypothetical protein [Crassvirales sp.]DAO31068.1 MAG TPA: hypothetical protein [Crassvirales sp.]
MKVEVMEMLVNVQALNGMVIIDGLKIQIQNIKVLPEDRH